MAETLSLREVQMAELDILVMFDEYCKKNDLQYVLYYGTLLGAVRHHGFIPWDDDIDIAMPRPDYERMIKLYYDEKIHFSDRYFLKTGERDEDFAFAFAKVFCRDYEIAEESKLYHNDSDFLWIDIFPIDGFPADWQTSDYLKRLGKYQKNIGRSITIPGTIRGHENKLKSIVRLPVAWFYNAIGYKKFRNELMALAKSYPYETSEWVGLATWNNASAGLVERREDFTKFTTLPFEGHDFPVSQDYLNYLRNRYGETWNQLPPEDQRMSHFIKVKKVV